MTGVRLEGNLEAPRVIWRARHSNEPPRNGAAATNKLEQLNWRQKRQITGTAQSVPGRDQPQA